MYVKREADEKVTPRKRLEQQENAGRKEKMKREGNVSSSVSFLSLGYQVIFKCNIDQ